MQKFTCALACGILLGLGVSAQEVRGNGYKGIWFSLGQYSTFGDKYSGGLGTYTANHIPMAIYSKAANKTFFVYGGTSQADRRELQIMLSYFDHQKGTVPRPCIVYEKKEVDDPHDNPSISIDEKGFIWVFISGRNTRRPGLIYKSHQPYQIDSMVHIKTLEITYPQPWYIPEKGFFHFYTRYTKGRELYWSSSRDGTTWKEESKLAGFGGHYQLSTLHGDKIFTVFNYHPGGDVDKRTNLYLVYTDDMGASWKNIQGTVMNTPLSSPQNAALVKDFQQEGKLVYLNDIQIDKEGNPILLAVVSRHHQPGPQGDPREWMVIQYKKGRWELNTVCNSTHNYDMGSLYVGNKTLRIIGPTEAGPQPYGTGGEMACWESNDQGKTWMKKYMLTQNSSKNHSYARRPLHAHKDFIAFWADGNADTFSASSLYFANSKGKVFQLPYNMKYEEEKPIRLKTALNQSK